MKYVLCVYLGIMSGMLLYSLLEKKQETRKYAYNIVTDGIPGSEHWSYYFMDTKSSCAVAVQNGIGSWSVVLQEHDGNNKMYDLPTWTSADYVAHEHCHGFIKPW